MKSSENNPLKENVNIDEFFVVAQEEGEKGG